MQKFKADLILFLDVLPSQGMRRVKGRGHLDRIEQESMDFFTRVYQAYHKYICEMDNVRIVDASSPLKAAQASILSHLQEFLLKNAYV